MFLTESPCSRKQALAPLDAQVYAILYVNCGIANQIIHACLVGRQGLEPRPDRL